MARTVIPTNFQDDELAEEMQGRRRYRQILNTDGTVSFEDETDYDTEGSTFGASRVNEMAQNINESADVNKIIDDLEDISVVTQNGFIAGAKAVKELNNNLTANGQPFRYGYDSETDKYGYIREVDGADTFFPFNGGEIVTKYSGASATGGKGNTRSTSLSYTIPEDGTYFIVAPNASAGLSGVVNTSSKSHNTGLYELTSGTVVSYSATFSGDSSRGHNGDYGGAISLSVLKIG